MEQKDYKKIMLISVGIGVIVGLIILGIILAIITKNGNKKANANQQQSLVSTETSVPEGETESTVAESTSDVESSADENSIEESTIEESTTEESTVEESVEASGEESLVSEESQVVETEESSEEESSEEVKEDAEKEEKIIANLSMGDAWGNGGNYNYKFDLSIENKSDSDIKDWTITLYGGEYKVESYWNCNPVEKDGSIVVTPVDYTSEVKAGNTQKDMGIVIQGKDEKAAAMRGMIIAKTNAKDLQGDVYVNGKNTAGDNASVQKQEDKKEEKEDKKEEKQENNNSAKTENGKAPDINVGDRLAGHTIDADSPLGKHGRLHVEGAQLMDQYGKVFQMHGVSTHGLAWFPEYVSEESFRTFKNNWGVDVMRLAMYTAEYGGYCSGGDKNNLKNVVSNGVEYASKLGMYVIIDWHILSDNNPNTNKEEAIAFFDEMSKKYAGYGNVIYEICNEPNGSTNWSEIRSYAVDVIETIRKNDPYAIILVGTPQWSQLIQEAAKDPLDEYDNVMYTMHFYAATHKDDLRKNLETAYNNGMPIYISECSICDASGNGNIDYESAKAWKELLDKYQISYIAWSVCNKNESASLIKSSCSKTSDWADNELSDTGVWFKESFK